ncbi:MAG: S9 family peptidase [Gemmatimonadaceae bacterium]
MWLTLSAPAAMFAQEGYKQPPAPIAQMLDAPPPPLAIASPDRTRLLLVERSAMPTIAEVAAPELRLAGDRIDPRTNGRSRGTTYAGLRLRATDGAAESRIVTPAGARIGAPHWSPDSRRVAFTVTQDSGIALYVADASSGASRRLTPFTLNAATGAPCAWMGSTRLLCHMIRAGRGRPPAENATPAGPIVQEADGRASPNRTYQDLLASPRDERLFEYYLESQLAVVGVEPVAPPQAIGSPGLYTVATPSPDANYIAVSRLHRPFSYLVPAARFPAALEVWDASGRVVRAIADVPLQENVPTAFDAVPTGPRNIAWRADQPATLVWTEALDGGDVARAVAKRDRLAALAAPFTGEPRTLLDVATRVAKVTWGNDRLALVTEHWWKSRRSRTWAIDPTIGSGAAVAPRLLFDLSSEDRYADPGTFVTRPASDSSASLLLTSGDGHWAYLAGAGASAEGDRPFLDRIELATGRRERLWRSAAPFYEEVVTLLDADARRIVTRRESATEVPNYVVRDVAGGGLVALTRFTDPAPQFAGVTSQLITYTRADGVQLSATLYLPAGYDRAQGPLPFLLWAYPREFKTAAAAAQVQGSPFRFTRPTGPSHLFVLTQGYGVLDGPAMPIVGEGSREPNDSYVEQLVASAKAAVDKIVAMGVADRDRIAVGGHSYGAFMTANLLAHSQLFRAGIARSGAYNRTLTPFGFQQEERPFWKARDIYAAMSPFNAADSVRAPLLLMHGMADDNSGTFPIQTERFYAALKGNGARVRYVQLPGEAHAYRARESVGHTLWEMVTWLDSYVKGQRVRA